MTVSNMTALLLILMKIGKYCASLITYNSCVNIIYFSEVVIIVDLNVIVVV